MFVYLMSYLEVNEILIVLEYECKLHKRFVTLMILHATKYVCIYVYRISIFFNQLNVTTSRLVVSATASHRVGQVTP